MYLVFTKKFSDTYWKLLGWIVYISLMATSVWFTWGVLEKFAKQETAIQQYEDKIEAYPTISICNFWPYFEYQNNFNLTYTTNQSNGSSVEIVLKMGENDLGNSEGIVNLSIIYTRYDRMCYTINTNRNADYRETKIKILSHDIKDLTLKIFFTSEKNSYGITRRDWRDGEFYSNSMSIGMRTDVTLTVEKTISLKCSEESFYEYVASKLSEQVFEKCDNETCLMTSLPNDPYQICPKYKELQNWGKFDDLESDCHWKIVKDLIQNITNNDEHLKTCITTKYSGISSKESTEEETEIRYKFALPLKAKVYEEYLIIDSIGLIGSVGGTLGMFIGFSFANLIICIIDYIQYQLERKLISRNKCTETIWKCLKWIIYFSLMAAAIIFAKDIIEKFFGQNTGIKQNMEKIESHPTITICPFLDQCGSPGIPQKIIVELKGAAKDAQSNKEGIYILSTILVNDKEHWIHDSGSNALWYEKGWYIGQIENLGISTANSIYSPDDSEGPLEATTWKYFKNGHCKRVKNF